VPEAREQFRNPGRERSPLDADTRGLVGQQTGVCYSELLSVIKLDCELHSRIASVQ
jgi:hypothetical protein